MAKVNSDNSDKSKSLLPPDDKFYGIDDSHSSVGLTTIGQRGRGLFGGHGIRAGITHLHYAGGEISPYGFDIYLRDWQLRQCVRQISWLSSTVRNVSIRMSNVPYEIRAKNASVISHVEMAKKFNDIFWNGDPLNPDSEGWFAVRDRFIDGILTQDNPPVLEILDNVENAERSADLPRLGFGGFRYWDSQMVIRKKSSEFPVAISYKPEGDEKFRQYKLHHTRVISIVDMESGDFDLNGIGFCATSRAIDFFKDLDNLTTTKDENYGDGEPDQIWVLKSNQSASVGDGTKTLDAIEEAYRIKRQNTATQKTARRLKLEITQDDSFDVLPAKTLPDGLKESEITINGMKGMAASFNVPLRFVWTRDTGSGLAGRGDADLDQDIAESGMFTWFGEQFDNQIERKVLPLSLQLVRTTTNDKEDLQASEIELKKTQADSQQLADGAIDIRAYRIDLLDSGNLSEAEFIRLELEDGRMRDGKPVVDKFYDNRFADVLTLEGVEDPLDVDINASEELVDLLGDKARQVKRLRESIIDDGRRVTERDRLTIAHSALTRLQSLYMERLESLEMDTDETRPEQDDGEQAEDKAIRFRDSNGEWFTDSNKTEEQAKIYGYLVFHFDGKPFYQSNPKNVIDNVEEMEYMFDKVINGLLDSTLITDSKAIDLLIYNDYLPDDYYLKKKAIKAINDDLDLYQTKLEQILLRTNNGEIDEDASKDRIAALASAMLIISFLLGRQPREDQLTGDEAVLMAGARQILNNGGITNPDFTQEQLDAFNEGLAVINDDTLKADVLSADELTLLNQQTAINQDSAVGVVDWALGLTAVLVGQGLVDAAFDDELRKRIVNRVAKWKNNATGLVQVGKVAISPFALFRWDISPPKDNCATCLGFNGKIKTGAEWFEIARTTNQYPRGSGLICGGWFCGCFYRLVENQ